MKDLSVVWTETVDILEVRFGLAAVQEIIGDLQTITFRKGFFYAAPSVNVFGNWIIPSLPEGAPYRSLQWYIDQSYDRARRSVIGSKLLELIVNEPWQKSNAHYDLFLLGQSLVPTAEYPSGQQVLALSMPGRATVISAVPLRQIQDDRLRLFTIRRVVGHQLGHLIGVPSPSRPETILEPSGERHCPNVCVMRDSPELEKLVQMALEELRAHVMLCPACRQDLLDMMMDAYFGRN